MSAEHSENRTALLRSLLEDDNYCEFSNQLKRHSLDRFRRAVSARRAIRTMSLFCGTTISISALLMIHPIGRRQSLPGSDLVANGLMPNKNASLIRTLSDEEAIASFPRGSCFFAEVEGKKILVFPDPALRHLYLH